MLLREVLGSQESCTKSAHVVEFCHLAQAARPTEDLVVNVIAGLIGMADWHSGCRMRIHHVGTEVPGTAPAKPRRRERCRPRRPNSLGRCASGRLRGSAPHGEAGHLYPEHRFLPGRFPSRALAAAARGRVHVPAPHAATEGADRPDSRLLRPAGEGDHLDAGPARAPARVQALFRGPVSRLDRLTLPSPFRFRPVSQRPSLTEISC